MIKGFAVAAATVLAFAASAASATEYNVGQLSVPYTQAVTAPVGTISDDFLFDLNAGDLGAGLASVAVSLPGLGSAFNISGLGGSLYTGGGSLIGSFGMSGTFADLVAGSYRLHVGGTADGSLGGVYALSLVPASAVPVPGPAGILVAIGGAATVGWRNRKKRRAEAKLATA